MSFYPTKLLVGCVIKEESLQLSLDGFFRTSFKTICLLFAGCAHWSPNFCPSKAALNLNRLMQIKYDQINTALGRWPKDTVAHLSASYYFISILDFNFDTSRIQYM